MVYRSYEFSSKFRMNQAIAAGALALLSLVGPGAASTTVGSQAQRQAHSEVLPQVLPQAQLQTQLQAQRGEYKLALQDLAANRIGAFKSRQQKLEGYALAPYLDYHYANKNVAKMSAKAVDHFTATYQAYPFAETLRSRWLLKLPAQGRWLDYLNNYEQSSSATRQCFHLRALYRSGEKKAALDQVENLWVHGKSQPKACDSLFRTWMNAGYLTDRMVWQRIGLALANNEVTLTRYLLKQIKSARLKQQATLLYQAHVQPLTLFDPQAHKDDNATNRAILATGIQRLARKDPASARDSWRRVSRSHSFSSADRNAIEARLLIEGAQKNMYPAVTERPAGLDDGVLQRVAREAVRNQNWAEAQHWIGAMSETIRATSEWRYWFERSAAHTSGQLATLAEQRNYYGFLAAADLGRETRLNHQPTTVPLERVAAVGRIPGIDRALELFAVDDHLNARREWRQAFAQLEQSDRAAAAQLAKQRGWLHQAIVAANAADLHNDLDLRFPNVFETEYNKASAATKLPPSLLLAVTRQESAFQQKARSSANARGLMQLLPSTAKHTARRAGLRQPSTSDLYKPDVNIRIASEYLSHLMQRYNQQRPLALAAYNAGEHRVDRWIKDREGMPMEVWIETIPYKETRGYVKSVLAFNHLYSKRLNDPVPLLQPHERKVLNRS